MVASLTLPIRALADTSGRRMISVDFGNGIVAGGASTDTVRILDYSGVDFPEAELTITEATVVDGGRFSSTRAKSRRMTWVLDFARSPLSRAQIAAAFAPGSSGILSTARGSMPYYVDGQPAFSDKNLTRPTKLSVSLVSPLAYPEAAERTIDTTTEVSSVSVDSHAQVETHPVVELWLSGPVTDLVVTSNGATTTLVGDYLADDHVVINPTAATVTVNGTNALSALSRPLVWPTLPKGSSTVAVNVDSRIKLTWKPRILGLF